MIRDSSLLLPSEKLPRGYLKIEDRKLQLKTCAWQHSQDYETEHVNDTTAEQDKTRKINTYGDH